MSNCMQLVRITLVVWLAAAAASVHADQAADARAAASQLVQKLGSALKQELARGGPATAIGVCRDVAPALAGELSRSSGSRVARVSLKARNPLLGEPDAWEQQVLADFDRRAAAGEHADSLEYMETVDEPQGRYFRYMKALPVQPLCLGCHGDAEAISKQVRAQLASAYPHDRAFGYTLGQIRGAVTIKQRLEAGQ